MNNNNGTIVLERAAVETAVTVKVGMDVHAAFAVVCVQVDGSLPRPSRRMSFEQLLELVAEHTSDGAKVFSCYEAGPCGYWLHRRLMALGVGNYVVVPRSLDPEHRRVKTDKRDARALLDSLDRYLRGNDRAFTTIRVPTPEQEQRRSLGRQRGTFVQERQRCVVRGHGLMLAQGVQAAPGWWRQKAWETLAAELPAWLREQVNGWALQARLFDAEVEKWSEKVVPVAAGKVQPKGVGELTTALIELEVLEWSRFKNRRQVASYTGLIPSEYSSGNRRRQGAITKHGNPRLRHLLVEAVWRLHQWQPEYPPLRLLRAAVGKRARKRAVVAVARRLAIDLWRIHTNQCTAEKLGLKLR